MQSEPASEFQKRIERFDQEIIQVNKRLDSIAWTRLLVFAVAGGLQIWSWYQNDWLWLPMLVAGLAGFIAIIKWNNRVNQVKVYLELKKRINEEELLRKAGDLAGFESGEEYLDPLHPYSGDLDLFGHHSLYQLVNRATTLYGKDTLTDWMKSGGDAKVIRERQNTVAALAPALEWRQNFQATGMQSKAPGDSLDILDRWMKEEPVLAPKPMYRLLPFILPPITITLAVLALIPLIHWGFPLGLFALHVLANRTINKYSEAVFTKTEKRATFLAAFSRLIEQMETLEVDTPQIKELKSELAKQGKPAYEEIATLSNLLSKLELRLNGLPYFIMNAIFFWDMYWLVRLENWKQKHQNNILGWFEAIGKVEALSSLAAVRYAYPEWVVPTLKEGDFYLSGESLGHPLIESEDRISNPINLPAPGRIWLITGSNMSGKSTFLRTVGINVVLGLMGAPVCAGKMALSPLQVATSMRTLDSIEENTSSFYAELKRLKMVIERVERGETVLFLLDEILKGTNSRDRHAGARALVTQLHKHGGAGLVSTHDLELVDLETELAGNVTNYSFNCEVSPEGKLKFDYTLTDGVCRSMNATALMRTMGIKM